VRTIFKERRLQRHPEPVPAPARVLQQEGDRR
jgi:hypothetical protein